MNLYFYPSSAFEGGLPVEHWGRAWSGRQTSLTLRPDAEGQSMAVADDDGVFDEVDSNQTLDAPLMLSGQEVPVGTSVHSSYDLINSGSGMKVTSIHLGGTGYEQGAVHGLISTEPLTPGKTYTFDINRTSFREHNSYDDFVPCLLEGTRLMTPRGPRPVEALEVGDEVVTLDAGAMPVRAIWVGAVPGRGRAAPIVVPPGGLENDAALSVSPEHRVLLRGAALRAVTGRRDEALVAAKFLAGYGGIAARPRAVARYWHLMLATHAVVFAEGQPVETYLLRRREVEPWGAPAFDTLRAALPPHRRGAEMAPVRPVLRRRDLPAARPV